MTDRKPISALVSIVIPCRNEEKYIQSCIVSLLENGYPQDLLEIIVVDGMSTDKTKEKVLELKSNFEQVKWVENKQKKTPFALNIGINTASGEYILIASAHSSFDENYISILVEKMNSLKADVVGGVMQTAVKNETKTSLAIQSVLAHRFGVGNSMFRVGVEKYTEVDTVPFGLYKTELLKKVQGYDERLIRNHDIELSKRLLALGTKIYLIPSASCTYYARETWGALAKNNFNNGKWNLLTVYLTRDFSSLSLRHFIPLLFVLSLLLPIFGMIIHPLIGLLAVASLTLYSAVLLYFTAKMDKSKTDFIHIFLTFIVLHFAYGFGSLVGGVQLQKITQ